jgi:hypothetical protein
MGRSDWLDSGSLAFGSGVGREIFEDPQANQTRTTLQDLLLAKITILRYVVCIEVWKRGNALCF